MQHESGMMRGALECMWTCARGCLPPRYLLLAEAMRRDLVAAMSGESPSPAPSRELDRALGACAAASAGRCACSAHSAGALAAVRLFCDLAWFAQHARGAMRCVGTGNCYARSSFEHLLADARAPGDLPMPGSEFPWFVYHRRVAAALRAFRRHVQVLGRNVYTQLAAKTLLEVTGAAVALEETMDSLAPPVPEYIRLHSPVAWPDPPHPCAANNALAACRAAMRALLDAHNAATDTAALSRTYGDLDVAMLRDAGGLCAQCRLCAGAARDVAVRLRPMFEAKIALNARLKEIAPRSRNFDIFAHAFAETMRRDSLPIYATPQGARVERAYLAACARLADAARVARTCAHNAETRGLYALLDRDLEAMVASLAPPRDDAPPDGSGLRELFESTT